MTTRSAFDRVRVRTPVGERSMTEQSHARACDINTIMMRFQKDGVITHMSKYEPQYGDVTEADYKASQDLVARVKTEFEELPAFVRKEFPDGVGEYLELTQTEEGIAELREILHPGEKYDKEGKPDQKGREAAREAPDAAEAEPEAPTD